MDTFSVEIDPEHSDVLRVSGELDIAVADSFFDRGRAALDGVDSALVVDFGGVTFIDSTGLGALVRLREAALEQGKSVKVAHVPRQVGRVLEVTGLSDMFPDGADG